MQKEGWGELLFFPIAHSLGKSCDCLGGRVVFGFPLFFSAGIGGFLRQFLLCTDQILLTLGLL
jgi:hypothetical protein